jgi:predicted acyl esterase
LQDSAIRMRWRYGGLTPLSMAPGEVYEVKLSLWNTSYVVASGHALRVSISSSNYPRFDVNQNNGILLANQSPNDVNYTATNTLYHSMQYPSHVTLPVVTRRDLPEVRNIEREARKAYPGVDFESIVASE